MDKSEITTIYNIIKRETSKSCADVISRASAVFGEKLGAVMALEILELLSSALVPSAIALMLGENEHPKATDEITDRDLFSALLMYNLILRKRESTRTIFERTANSFEANYGRPSKDGAAVLEIMKETIRGMKS